MDRRTNRRARGVKVSEFDFELPPELIAQHPMVPRDAARMLEVQGAMLADRSVRDLPQDVKALRVSLVDRRGQRSHVATRRLPGRD